MGVLLGGINLTAVLATELATSPTVRFQLKMYSKEINNTQLPRRKNQTLLTGNYSEVLLVNNQVIFTLSDINSDF